MARLLLLGVAAAGLLAACDTPASAQPMPSATQPAGRASGLPVVVAPADSRACAAADLNAVVAPAPPASGGQAGVQLAFGNQSGAGCTLRGTPTVQLLDPGNRQIPITNLAVDSGSSTVVLVPGHVALDAAHPQIGEAQLLLSWHTGNVQPGVCTRQVTPASLIRVTLPSGAVEAHAYFINPPIAPCDGKLQVDAFRPVGASPQAYADPKSGAIAAMELPGGARYSPGSCTPTQQHDCLTGGGVTLGTGAAYVSFENYGVGGGASCLVYLFKDNSGWHVRDRACTQNIGLPARGKDDVVQNVPGACANFHSSPGRTTRVMGCLAADNALFTLDDGPVYVPEADAADNLPFGTLWWHVSGKGWIAHDFLTSPQ